MKIKMFENADAVLRRELIMFVDDEIQRNADTIREAMERQNVLSEIRESLKAERYCFADDYTDRGDCPYTEDEIRHITLIWLLHSLRGEL